MLIYCASSDPTNAPTPKEEIVIVVVVCGLRVDETLNMVKSALLFNTSRHPLRFVIITEDKLRDYFKEKVRKFEFPWKKSNKFLISVSVGRLVAVDGKRLQI